MCCAYRNEYTFYKEPTLVFNGKAYLQHSISQSNGKYYDFFLFVIDSFVSHRSLNICYSTFQEF